VTLDPRLNAVRPDLAAASLKGKVEATRFAEGEAAMVTAAVMAVRKRPEPSAARLTEALCGERATVYERANGWAWVQLEADGYVGYVPEGSLGAPVSPTHRIAAPKTFVYPEPNLKAMTDRALYLTSAVTIEAVENGYGRLASGGYVHLAHLKPLGEPLAADPAGVAELYAGVPYLWGGKSHEGLDCSGLVQLALSACGIVCPRDSDMQEAAAGEALPGVEPRGLRRNDLLFWKGHAGLMLDSERLIHANGFHMRVEVEPVAAAIARIASQYGQVTRIRRPRLPQ
jgi:cell wall-associated NlpC family hydrolase